MRTRSFFGILIIVALGAAIAIGSSSTIEGLIAVLRGDTNIPVFSLEFDSADILGRSDLSDRGTKPDAESVTKAETPDELLWHIALDTRHRFQIKAEELNIQGQEGSLYSEYFVRQGPLTVEQDATLKVIAKEYALAVEPIVNTSKSLIEEAKSTGKHPSSAQLQELRFQMANATQTYTDQLRTAFGDLGFNGFHDYLQNDFLVEGTLTTSVTDAGGDVRVIRYTPISKILWNDLIPVISGYSRLYFQYEFVGYSYDPAIQTDLYNVTSQSSLDPASDIGVQDVVPAAIDHYTFYSIRNNRYCVITAHYALLFDGWMLVDQRNLPPTSDCHTVGPALPTPTPNPCDPANLGECQTPTPTPTPTVSITPIEVVEKHGTKDLSVTIQNNASGSTTFRLVTTAGTGVATFENGTNETIVNGNATNQIVKVKGVTESSQLNNIRIEARVNASSTVSAQDDFTVAVITSLEFERYDTTYLDLDDNPGTDGTYATGEGKRIYPDKKDVADVNTGTADRALVKVKANVLPAAANLTVYFASFDLDDPSAAGEPIDTTNADGKDNNGLVKAGNFVATGGSVCSNSVTGTSPNHVSTIQCATAADGSVVSVFKTTMQPGDNFAIAASVDSGYRNGMIVNASDGLQVVNSTSQALPLSGEPNPNSVAGLRTEMLTVWRKLHIEVDSMGRATQNFVRGNVSGNKRLVTGRRATINVTAPDLEPNRFENGRMVIAFITNVLTVTSNTSNSLTIHNQTANSVTLNSGVNYQLSNLSGSRTTVGTLAAGSTIAPGGTQTVPINSTPLEANEFTNGTLYITPVLQNLIVHSNTRNTVEVTNSGATTIVQDSTNFRLYDDDDMNDDGVKDGDENDDVPEPDTSLLTGNSHSPNLNVFAPAYVVPVYDLPNLVRDIPFVPSPTLPELTVLLSPPFFDNAAAERNPEFWTIYLLGAYQSPRYFADSSTLIRDGDPEIYSVSGLIATIYGATDSGSEESPVVRRNLGYGALIFCEVGRHEEYPTGYAARPVSRAYTTAHEVGHLFRGVHADGGLMSETAVRTSGVFSETSLAIIRSTEHP